MTNGGATTVSVIETKHNTVVGTVEAGDRPSGIAITPDDEAAYVAILNSANVSVIDLASNAVVGTIAVGRSPSWVAMSPF